jgi:hypothetical protein
MVTSERYLLIKRVREREAINCHEWKGNIKWIPRKGKWFGIKHKFKKSKLRPGNYHTWALVLGNRNSIVVTGLGGGFIRR